MNTARPVKKRIRRLVLLGATGTLGTMVLDVLRTTPGKFRLVGMSAGKSLADLLRLARQFQVSRLHLSGQISGDFRKPNKITVWQGEECWNKFFKATQPDLVINCIAGAGGLPATLAVLNAGVPLALANKESLVMAGRLVMKLAAQKQVPIIPVDSEHSAIFQLLQGVPRSQVKNIILTASGGMFLRRPLKEFPDITPAEAVKHPNWKMGQRITVDSGTMANKALEVVEAFYLFGFPPERIKVVINPQSFVHGMVELNDGTILAQISAPDMRDSIRYALNYPTRSSVATPSLFSRKVRLDFEAADKHRFPALSLGYEVIKRGGAAGAVFNAADEEAVRLFLEKKIKFTDIYEIVRLVLRRNKFIRADNLASIKKADQWAREEVGLQAQKIKKL